MKVQRNGKARVLTSPELDRLLEAAPSPAHRALWAVQRWSAARIAEALALRWGAVAGGCITFVRSTTKTRNTCQVRACSALEAELAAYKASWALAYGREPESGDLLFPARCSMAEPMTRQAADLALRKAAASLGLEGVSTHSFRRSFCTGALRRGADLRTIQAVTGHKSLGSLGEYLEPDDAAILAILEGA